MQIRLRQTFPAICLFALSACLSSTKKEAGKTPDKEWTSATTNHFTMHAQKGVRSQGTLASIGQKMERIQKELLALLSENQTQKLTLYFLKDRQTLSTYTGYPAKGYTDTQKGILYFVDKDPYHLPLKHETAHALSWRLWGTPKEYWINEGLAVFAIGGCGGYPLHTLAHAMNREKKLEPFQNIVDSFDFRALEPSLQAASVVQYIYDQYGLSALKAFWQTGWQSSVAITGLPAIKLEQQWKAWIDQDKFKAAVQWQQIKDSGCE